MDGTPKIREKGKSSPLPYALLMFGATRRLSGVSYRDFSTKPEATANSYLAAYEKFGGLLNVWIDLSVEAADFGQKMVYPENSTPHPDYKDPVIKAVSDYRKIKRINFKEAQRMQAMLETLHILVNSKKIKEGLGSLCFGPLGVLGMMRGAEHLFRDCVLYPSEVTSAMETVTGVLIEYCEAMCDAGVFGVCLDTLYASWSGLSKALWEKLEGPFVRELAKAIRSKNRAVFVHNCGDGPYFDSQIRFMEPAIISFAQLPDDCPNRKELKRRYGKGVVLMGHINTPLLSYGTPNEVKEECKVIMDDLAPEGNFILGPGCEFPPNAPFENAMAIVEAAKQLR